MSRNTRSTTWFWLLLVVGALVAAQALIAVATHDSACATESSPKHWVLFPPHWECERSI